MISALVFVALFLLIIGASAASAWGDRAAAEAERASAEGERFVDWAAEEWFTE